jgi:hypothetical protein
MSELFSPIGNHADESPCTWIEEVGMWIGSTLPALAAIALGFYGPELSNLLFN